MCLIIAVTVMVMVPSVMAEKDRGNQMVLPEWGIITVPDNIYMDAGKQPVITAQKYNNDMGRMLDAIYPAVPRTYQLIKKEGASFHYGYLLQYTLGSWDFKQLVNGKTVKFDRPDYLQDQGAADISMYVTHINNRLRTSLPSGFNLIQPMQPVKISGNTFYEGIVERSMIINAAVFQEMMHVIVWQRGGVVEITVVMGSADDEESLIRPVMVMLENAKVVKQTERIDI